MVTLQNIGTATQTLIVSDAYVPVIKKIDPLRFVHLSDQEYNYVAENGLKPLTSLDGETEDNTSYVWKWIRPIDAFGNPIVPLPPPENSDVPIQTPDWQTRDGIEDKITDGITDKAPSENAVYDALATKAEWQGGSIRPLSPKPYEMWFDATLDRPIWWSGSQWIDLLSHEGTTHSGNLTVSGDGDAQVIIDDQPLNVTVEFSDPEPPHTGCGNASTDLVEYVIQYTPMPSPLYTLKINWEIHSGGTRQITWQAIY